jgi:hypothetical protein
MFQLLRLFVNCLFEISQAVVKNPRRLNLSKVEPNTTRYPGRGRVSDTMQS